MRQLEHWEIDSITKGGEIDEISVRGFLSRKRATSQDAFLALIRWGMEQRWERSSPNYYVALEGIRLMQLQMPADCMHWHYISYQTTPGEPDSSETDICLNAHSKYFRKECIGYAKCKNYFPEAEIKRKEA